MEEKKGVSWVVINKNDHLAILANDLFMMEIIQTRKKLPWLLRFYLNTDEGLILFSRAYRTFLKAESKANEIAQALELL